MIQKIPTVSEYFLWKSTGRNAELIAEIDSAREQNPDFQIPYYPEESDYIRRFSCNTQDIKTVADYSNMNFNEVLALDIFTYWAWLHDAVVWNCERTSNGRDYLEKAWAGSQTEPDREAFRAVFG
ncbi:MAG: hypothetical protein NC340_08935 [Ruminococcus flavefaciens]|nr:hypothetical protein [Ruminococcus flavefaciens]MCM1232663.1 hypothetical protein [Ruminococcus flavefaciens]